MKESNRTPLQPINYTNSDNYSDSGTVIRLKPIGSRGNHSDIFQIEKELGEGGSCACYEAILLNHEQRGQLKEFYPISSPGEPDFGLIRNGANQVVASPDAWTSFEKMLANFKKPYKILRKKMVKDPSTHEFKNFIPEFILYRACDENGNFLEYSTVYVWTVDPKLTVFSDYVNEVHNGPRKSYARKLFTMLQVMHALTERLDILHKEGLLHLDVKPANFGVPSLNTNLMADGLKFFDVSSFIPKKDSKSPWELGTIGFNAPEVRNLAPVSVASDIYSVGCTLFYALGLLKDQYGELVRYSDQYYSRISRLIDESPLLDASNITGNIFLKATLIQILTKCLHISSDARYKSCKELIQDLKAAISILTVDRFQEDMPAHQKLAIIEKELENPSGPGAHLTFLYHLCQHPLYGKDKEKDLNVLIIGFGNYGQAFMDCCLQVGQQRNVKLNVTVMSQDRLSSLSNKDLYINKRPALSSLFSIDGSNVTDPYGTITFRRQKVTIDTVKDSDGYSKYNYIFVALGKDEDSLDIAKKIARTLSGTDSTICCALEKKTGNIRKSNVLPIYMSKDITTEPAYKQLEQMAFNAHLLWLDGLNIDLKKEWQKFKEDTYNYRSSMANALSIKYRLHDLGVPIEPQQPESVQNAVNDYRSKLMEDVGLRGELAALEHRRWNVDMACKGYTTITDLTDCLTVTQRDTAGKRHACLVRSFTDSSLESEKWKDHSAWDNATDADLESLDELDRLSVRLHQVYRREAMKKLEQNSLFDNELKSIVSADKDASIAFSEWQSVLERMWSGTGATFKEYRYLMEALKNKLTGLEPDMQQKAKDHIRSIDQDFKVIVNSRKYTDWKKNDEVLVDGIPFILTYRDDFHIAIPFSTGSNDEHFKNVAAPTIINPAQVTYLYDVGNGVSEAFYDGIRYVLRYFPEKNVKAKIRFLLLYEQGAYDSSRSAEIERQLKDIREQLQSNRSVEITSLYYTTDNDLTQQIAEPSKSPRFHALEQNDTPLSLRLRQSGLYGRVPHYAFDIVSQRFPLVQDCDFISHIYLSHIYPQQKRQYLKASDMLASADAKGVVRSPLTFYRDYEKLWKDAYRGKETVWRELCGLLARYHENDTVVSIPLHSVSCQGELRSYRYILPTESFAGAKKLITVLTQEGVFGSQSAVYHYTPDSCEAVIYIPEALHNTMMALFADPALIERPERLSFVKTDTELRVLHDRLSVHRLDLSASQQANAIKELLTCLQSRFSLIFCFTQSDSAVSFHYSTKQVKRLLTCEDQILKIYAYLTCLTSGLFDDVTASPEDGSFGPFDLIVTKGFTGLFVCIKPPSELSLSPADELGRSAKILGTNARAVLVSDTLGDPSEVESHATVRSVFAPKDVDEIHRTLAKLLEPPVPPA